MSCSINREVVGMDSGCKNYRERGWIEPHSLHLSLEQDVDSSIRIKTSLFPNSCGDIMIESIALSDQLFVLQLEND